MQGTLVEDVPTNWDMARLKQGKQKETLKLSAWSLGEGYTYAQGATSFPM